MKKIFGLFIFIGLFIISQAQAADLYTIDAAHSSIGFSVKHMMVSNVSGGFDQYEGTIAFDPSDLSGSKTEVKIETAGINTHVAKRDEHLKSADFFDAQKFPAITFTSKKITKSGDNYTIIGDLTLKGITKEVSIPVTIAGPVQSPMGAAVIGLSGQFTINRQDYGITWNKILDNGGFMVSNEVKVDVNVEAHNKK